MAPQNYCPVCKDESKVVQSAFISPWVRELGSIKARRTNYRRCQTCESGFFDYRYSESELSGIYSGYRGERYLALRQRWEPTYTAELNRALGHDAEVLGIRHRMVISALEQGLPERVDRIQTVVDVGGDQGQFIPPAIRNKFVLDVSGNKLVNGATRVRDNAEAALVRPDLVMACGVFEHLPNPIGFMNELVDIVRNQSSGLIYIEVPSGVPMRRSLTMRLMGNLFGSVAARSPRIWSMIDRRSADLNRRGRGPSRTMPMRQSEHINFFSMAGLRSLASSVGANVLVIDEVAIPTAILESGRVQFLGSLRMLAEVNSR